MMETPAGVPAGKQILAPAESYWADVQGDIEDVDGVLKITRIRVEYHLKVATGKEEDARLAMGIYLSRCPAAQSAIGCIDIVDNIVFEA